MGTKLISSDVVHLSLCCSGRKTYYSPLGRKDMSGKLFARKTDEESAEEEETWGGDFSGSKVDKEWGGKEDDELVRGKKSVKMMKAKLKEINKGKKRKKKKKRDEPEVPKSEKRARPILEVQKYHRGIYATLGWWLVLLPIFLIPMVGWLFTFTLVPFIAGRMGSRWLEKRYAMEMGILASIIVSVIEIMILYTVLDIFAGGTVNEVITGGIEYFFMTVAVISNICFCLLGTSSGKIKYFKNPANGK